MQEIRRSRLPQGAEKDAHAGGGEENSGGSADGMHSFDWLAEVIVNGVARFYLQACAKPQELLVSSQDRRPVDPVRYWHTFIHSHLKPAYANY